MNTVNAAKSYEYYNTSLPSKILTVLTSGFTEQNFLGQPWIPLLLKVTPNEYRRSLALSFLGVSPHYFIYQRSTKYPSTMSRMQILEAEHQRNITSRKKICKQILTPYLQPQMTALDFGCGPGYLAREVAKYVKTVYAVDISCGTIACAKELNNSDNISWSTNNEKNLSGFETSSVDLIYSFAVIQHLSEELFEGFLREFFRVLKPSGLVVCHIVLGENKPPIEKVVKSASFIALLKKTTLSKRFALRMIYRSAKDVSQMITTGGFEEPAVIPIKQISDLEDDIAQQTLLVFKKGSEMVQFPSELG